MAKIVKYCTACEEGFAEKFGFCPNCGLALTAFEMKPMIAEPIAESTPDVVEHKPIANSFVEEPIQTKAETIMPTPVLEIPQIEEIPATPFVLEAEPYAIPFDDANETIFEEELFSDIAEIENADVNEPIAASISAPIAQPQELPTILAKTAPQVTTDEFLEKETFGYVRIPAQSEFRPTFVDDRSGETRNALLLGAMILVLTVACGSWLYSLFVRQLDVAGLEDQVFVIGPQIDIAPDLAKEQEELEKNKDSGGGGGGGGKNEQTPTSKGQMARQMEKPDFTPSSTMERLTNPDLKIVVATEGKSRNEKIDPNQRYGDKNSDFNDLSDGTGSGGGMGSGTGTGQGSGRGTGRGSGTGSGSGSGIGSGIGSGTGPGGGDDGAPPPRPTPIPKPKAPAVTTALRITSQPKPPYTDAARLAQIQGVVRLRVTFSANGSIGGISPVSGLPNGLTEQAIAAARNIRFTPAMDDGVPKTTVKVIEYRFTIY